MIIGRLIGWGLFAIGLMLFGVEILASLQAEEWTPQLLGQVWFEIDSGSLNFTQAITQRYLHPVLWDPIVLTMLLWPAWVVFIVPGLLFSILFRNKKDRFAPRKYLN